MGEIFDTCNSTIFNLDIPSVIEWNIAFEPLPTVITKFGDLKGGNSLGTSPKDGNAFGMEPHVFSINNTFDTNNV